MTHPANLGLTLSGGSGDTAVMDLAVDPPRHHDFDQLDSLTTRFARGLHAAPGTRLGLLAGNSTAFVITLLGIMRAGAVAVPINTRFPDPVIDHVVQDSALAAVYADAAHRDRLPQSVEIRALDGHPDTSRPAAGIPAAANAQDTALVLYTSGSTGPPKGVELSHASQWSMVERMSGSLAGATGIVAAPLYHMNGLLFLMMLLNARGTVVLMPRFDARRYLQAVHDHRVQVVTGVPTMLAMMARETDLARELDLSSVTVIQIGSAPLSETVIRQAAQLFPDARLINGYGTTEAGAGMFGPHPERLATPAVSLGYPQPHVSVRLVGGASEDEGVLEVKTPAAMTGYLNQPDKTAARMSPDGWINTGDIMRRDADGFYYFVGRDDDMFSCGGENVYPGEVERVLEANPAIAECCVVPVPDEVRGQMPVAFVVPVAPGSIDEDAVKAIALAGAPAYMHPRRVYFLDEMPLAGTNKVDRRALTARAARLTS